MVQKSQSLFEDEDDDLKSKDERNKSPNACQKVIGGKPKIIGINQFHKSIVGKAANNETTRKTPTATSKKAVVHSIILLIMVLLYSGYRKKSTEINR